MFARGLNRMELYADERDRTHFLELLEEMVERYRVELHANDEITDAIARDRGEHWDRSVSRHGDTGVGLAMWLARRYTGCTLREIGEAMGGRDYAAVGMAIRRFNDRLQQSRELRARAEQVGKMLDVEMSP